MTRVKRHVVVVFVAGYLAIQVLVPAVALHGLHQDGDAGALGHFGWQMFSHTDE